MESLSRFDMTDERQRQTALITGASGGIGWATTELLAAKGLDLILLVRRITDEFKLNVEAMRQRAKTKVEIWEQDITDFESLREKFRNHFREAGAIDVLINNAAVSHGGLVQMTSLSTVREIFEINFFSQVFVAQSVLRPMVKNRHGSIVNVASIAGLDLHSGNIAYGTSKAALIAFTRTLAAEVGLMGVRVNAVAPGLTDTQMAQDMEELAGKEMVRRSAMNRLASPVEIANAIVFLALNESSFVNGHVLRVDGGQR